MAALEQSRAHMQAKDACTNGAFCTLVGSALLMVAIMQSCIDDTLPCCATLALCACARQFRKPCVQLFSGLRLELRCPTSLALWP